MYLLVVDFFFFFFSSRRRHTRFDCDWSSDVCSSDLHPALLPKFGGKGMYGLHVHRAVLAAGGSGRGAGRGKGENSGGAGSFKKKKKKKNEVNYNTHKKNKSYVLTIHNILLSFVCHRC